MKKTKPKNNNVMLSMKNWHGNWLESVLDVLDMLFFCIMTLWGILFSLRATKFHSASLILSYSNIRAFLTTLLKRISEGERTMQYTILPFITKNQCNWDCFSLKRSLYRLIYQSSVIKLSSFKLLEILKPNWFQKCMPDGLPSAPLPSSHTFTFLWKLVNPHKS